MTHFKIGKNGELEVAMFAGNVTDISADISMIISLVYGSMLDESKDAAEAFKENIESLVNNPKISEMVFNGSLAKSLKKSTISDKEELKKELLKAIIKELDL